jgi:pyruvate dehydrogenase E1 component
VIIQDGMRRMFQEQEDVFYYLTVMNENYSHPALPKGAEAGILKGLYRLSEGAKGKGKTREETSPRVQLMGSGTILREVMAAAELLEADWGVAADVWSATSFNELRREAQETHRWNLLHPDKKQKLSYVEQCLDGTEGPIVASTDYMRAFPDQIRPYVRAASSPWAPTASAVPTPRGAAPLLRGGPALRRPGRPQGPGRRRRDPRSKAAEAIKKYGIDADRPNPVNV